MCVCMVYCSCMCGIAGILKVHTLGEGLGMPHGQSIPESLLNVLDDSIRHRGPDGAGRFRDRAVRTDGRVVDVAMVHRRLSIIDLADGHQPMVHDGLALRRDLTYGLGDELIDASRAAPDKPIVSVVFNGCVYNHRALRNELEQRGARFGTDHSDTEVLIHGWRREGGGGMAGHLDGMFGFALWDRESARLTLGRDIAGEKPLWFWESADKDLCCFSSTPAGVFGVVKKLGVDVRASGAGRWLVMGFDGCSPWAEMKALTPGTVRAVLEPETEPVRYWQRAAVEQHASGVDLDEIESLIRAAVVSRLDADVPLGCFLSGGIDSGLIASIARQELGTLQTFTVAMPAPGFDESALAQRTAKALGTIHQTISCEPAPAEDLVALIHTLGTPLGDSSLLATNWVSKACKAHVGVALSGDGGDELFAGYRRYQACRWMNHTMARAAGLLPTGLISQQKAGSRATTLARLIGAMQGNGYTDLLAIFPSQLAQRMMPEADYGMQRCVPEDPRQVDFDSYLPEDLLLKVDTASMACALEVRSPFLERGLIDTMFGLGIEAAMPGGQPKGFLRQIAQRHLPPEVIDSPKRGFAIPIGQWFRDDYGSMRQLLHDHLESADPFPGLTAAGVEIDLREVQKLLAQHEAAEVRSVNPWKGKDHSQRLYALLVLSIWAKWMTQL